MPFLNSSGDVYQNSLYFDCFFLAIKPKVK